MANSDAGTLTTLRRDTDADMVEAAHVVEFLTALHTALSPALVWTYCPYKPHID